MTGRPKDQQPTDQINQLTDMWVISIKVIEICKDEITGCPIFLARWLIQAVRVRIDKLFLLLTYIKVWKSPKFWLEIRNFYAQAVKGVISKSFHKMALIV